MKLLTKNGLLAFFFSSSEEKKKRLRENGRVTACTPNYVHLEEKQIVEGLITFLLLDTCEIPKHQLLDSCIYDVLHA